MRANDPYAVTEVPKGFHLGTAKIFTLENLIARVTSLA